MADVSSKRSAWGSRQALIDHVEVAARIFRGRWDSQFVHLVLVIHIGQKAGGAEIATVQFEKVSCRAATRRVADAAGNASKMVSTRPKSS